MTKFGKHRRPSLRRFETDSLPERRLDHLLLRRHREVRNASPRNGGFVFHLFILLFFQTRGGERQSASWASAAAIRASISLISSCKVALRSTASSSNSDCFMSLVSNSRHTFRWCSIRAHNCAPFLGLVCQLHRKRNFLFLRSGHKGRLVFLVVLRAHDLLQKCNEPTSRWERDNRTRRRSVNHANQQRLVQRRKVLRGASRGDGLGILTLRPVRRVCGSRPLGEATQGTSNLGVRLRCRMCFRAPTPEATILDFSNPFLSTRQARPLASYVNWWLPIPLCATSESYTAAKSVIFPDTNTSHGIPKIHLLPIVSDPHIHRAIQQLTHHSVPLDPVYCRAPIHPSHHARARGNETDRLRRPAELLGAEQHADTDGDVHPS